MAILTLGELELVYGYFYMLWTCGPSPFPFPANPTNESWIISTPPGNDELSHFEVIVAKRKPRHHCPLYPEHVTEEFPVQIKASGNCIESPPFFRTADQNLVTDSLAERIKHSGLQGAPGPAHTKSLCR